MRVPDGRWTTVATAVAMALTTPALAQNAQDELTEVTVTGSRIARDGYEAPTPVSVLGMEQLS